MVEAGDMVEIKQLEDRPDIRRHAVIAWAKREVVSVDEDGNVTVEEHGHLYTPHRDWWRLPEEVA